MVNTGQTRLPIKTKDKPKPYKEPLDKEKYTKKQRVKVQIENTDDNYKDSVMELYLNYLYETNDPQFESDLSDFHDTDKSKRIKFVSDQLTPKYVKRVCIEMEKTSFCEKLDPIDKKELDNYILGYFEDSDVDTEEEIERMHRMWRP